MRAWEGNVEQRIDGLMVEGRKTWARLPATGRETERPLLQGIRQRLGSTERQKIEPLGNRAVFLKVHLNKAITSMK